MQHDGCPLPQADRRWALFLDFDGTLVDIAPTPMAVAVPAGLPPLLGRLNGLLGGALAIVSGRTIGDIDALLTPLRLAAAGQHGAEIRPAGKDVERFGRPDGLAGVAARIAAFAATRPGLLVEDKGMTVAIHCRLAPRYQAELAKFVDEIAAEHRDSLELIAGRRVFELRQRGLTKGSAVSRFMRTAPFAGRRPVFVGDDTTDEDGFAAALDAGGIAIRVGPPAPSRARWRIANPAAARAWLGNVADQLSATR